MRCLILIVVLLLFGYLCSIPLPHGAVGLSVVRDCGISRSYPLVFWPWLCDMDLYILSSFAIIDKEEMESLSFYFNSFKSADNAEPDQVKSSQVKYALFRHKQIHVSRPHMGDMASEKCINSKA